MRVRVHEPEVGRATSNKMEQTATVSVERRIKHPIYGKVHAARSIMFTTKNES
jgi:ribosomal protein S17